MDSKRCYILHYPKNGTRDSSVSAVINTKSRIVSELGYTPVSLPGGYINDYKKQLKLMRSCNCIAVFKIHWDRNTIENTLPLKAIEYEIPLISIKWLHKTELRTW